MPRARTIKHSFFTNDQLAEVPPLGRLLFIGLWTLADREGRLDYREKKLKAEILPYDDCDIEPLLTDLENRQFIRRYTTSKGIHIQVVNFVRHQRPHPKEPESEIPEEARADKDNVTAEPEQDMEEPRKETAEPCFSTASSGKKMEGCSFPSFPSGSSFPSGPALTATAEPPGGDAPFDNFEPDPEPKARRNDLDTLINVLAGHFKLALLPNERKYEKAAFAVLARYGLPEAETKIQEFLRFKPAVKLQFFDDDFASWDSGAKPIAASVHVGAHTTDKVDTVPGEISFAKLDALDPGRYAALEAEVRSEWEGMDFTKAMSTAESTQFIRMAMIDKLEQVTR